MSWYGGNQRLAWRSPPPCWLQAPSPDADTIKIGMTSALTGPYNEFGEGNRRAVELAVEQWNAKGGINGKEDRDRHAARRPAQSRPRGAEHPRHSRQQRTSSASSARPAAAPTLAVIDMVQADGRPYMNPIAQTPVVTYGREDRREAAPERVLVRAAERHRGRGHGRVPGQAVQARGHHPRKHRLRRDRRRLPGRLHRQERRRQAGGHRFVQPGARRT